MKRKFVQPILAVVLCVVGANAQSRLRTPINRNVTARLEGNTHPRARASADRGSVEPSFALAGITLYFKPSPAQKAALESLLADQQNPNSRQFHQWITPDQFADRFGASKADYDLVTAWLQSEGFTVDAAPRSRRWVTFRGNAAQVEKTFKTSIHRYQVDGQLHFANADDPSIPAALSTMVQNIRGLNDFRLKPRLHRGGLTANFNFSDGTHGMVPDDFATIYNVMPLYSAGIDGTGQKLVIVGQTAIIDSDIQKFRTKFNLPAQTIQKVLVSGSSDPGISSGDIEEANLDLQWAGALARNAQIIYVYSTDIHQSIEFAIDQNLAPVLSASYGICEPYDLIDLPSNQMTAQQANAQGITWINASGDVGASDCEDFSAVIAQTGLAVDTPADIPEVTGVGGTQFNEGLGAFWAPSNNANSASALSYIPEVVWNSTILDGTLSASGGGTSVLFAKPVWQTGPGVPSGGFRHTPDISFNSSSKTPYYVMSQGAAGYFYGTSAAAPSLAGILTLLNQYLVSTGAQKQPGLGNINPALYRLAQVSPEVFHDTKSGDNIVPCALGSPDCVNGAVGFPATVGFDRATGLGSIDTDAFIHKWTNSAPAGSVVVPSIDQIPVFQTGDQWTFLLTLNEEAGVGTTLLSMTVDGKPFDLGVFTTTTIPARGYIVSRQISLTQLSVPKSVVFGFSGIDANNRTWTQEFSAQFRGPFVKLTVAGAGNAASGSQAYAPGMLLSLYGTQMGDSAVAATAIPLPAILGGFEAWVNDVPAPLYFVSPGQVNIQIPYETQSGTATLVVGNPYDSAIFRFPVTTAAPGVFASNGFTVPSKSVQRGQTTILFITGEGRVTPSLPTGTTPDPGTAIARLPKPRLAASMTIGGQPATIQFIGIPSGLVGVTQVNFTVSNDTPLGVQPVVVTIGTVQSPPVNITVTE